MIDVLGMRRRARWLRRAVRPVLEFRVYQDAHRTTEAVGQIAMGARIMPSGDVRGRHRGRCLSSASHTLIVWLTTGADCPRARFARAPKGQLVPGWVHAQTGTRCG